MTRIRRAAPMIPCTTTAPEYVPSGWTRQSWLRWCERMVKVTKSATARAEWERRVEALRETSRDPD